jgi:hypothetical protein
VPQQTTKKQWKQPNLRALSFFAHLVRLGAENHHLSSSFLLAFASAVVSNSHKAGPFISSPPSTLHPPPANPSAPPRAADLALQLYYAQLALNLAWSPLFFGARQKTAALVNIVALTGTTVAMTVSPEARLDHHGNSLADLACDPTPRAVANERLVHFAHLDELVVGPVLRLARIRWVFHSSFPLPETRKAQAAYSSWAFEV